MDDAISSKLENIFTENVEDLACRICFTFDNVQEAFQCSYNDQTIPEVVNILLYRVSSNNLEKLCMNCIKAVINVHLFLQKLNDRETFWEKARPRPRTKSAQEILLPLNNDTASLYDENLFRIDRVRIKNEDSIDGKNTDYEHTDYELIIKDELAGLNDACEQIEDVPEYCHVVDDNHDYSTFDDEDDVPLIRLATINTPMTTATGSILKDFSKADDIKLKSKCVTAAAAKRRKKEKKKLSKKPTPTKKSRERVLCKECGKTFSPAFIESHMMEHEQGLFQCNICGYDAIEKYHLAQHAKQHEKVEPLVCRFCEALHDNLYDYKNHMKTHNVKRIFYRDLALKSDANECKECGKTYALAHSLSAHMRTHKKDTGTWCTLCQKGFTSTALYRVHMRKHTGERPFACPHCPKRYNAEGELKVHVACHENKREFRCEFCPKTFNRKTSLHTHRHIHTDKTFVCEFCNRQYRDYYSFRKHIRTSHQETNVSRQSTFNVKVGDNGGHVVSEDCAANVLKKEPPVDNSEYNA